MASPISRTLSRPSLPIPRPMRRATAPACCSAERQWRCNSAACAPSIALLLPKAAGSPATEAGRQVQQRDAWRGFRARVELLVDLLDAEVCQRASSTPPKGSP